MITTIQVATSELRRGDVVLSHGMRVLLDGECTSRVDTYGTGREVFWWDGLVLNPDDAINVYRIPRTFIGDYQWDDSEGWVFVQTNRWTVQGNDLARWAVERDV